MPLAPEAKATNIEKSLVAWLQAKLVTIAGLSVFYDEEPDRDRPDAWIHVDVLLGLRSEFGRQIDRTHLGARTHGILQLSLCKKRSSITNIYGMAMLTDTASAAFKMAQDIPLRNYDAVGTPVIGLLSVTEHPTVADVDDGRTSGVMVKVLSIPMTYTEAWTLV